MKRRARQLVTSNYITKIAEMVMDGKIIPDEFGQIKNIQIFHDPWCDSHRGFLCNCAPFIHVDDQYKAGRK